MPKLEFTKFNINVFWEKLPTVLKYIIIIALIIVGSYFFISRKVDKSKTEEIAKIEQSINAINNLINSFELYKISQKEYNEQSSQDLKNIYTLVNELNYNVNSKFNFLINNSNNQDLTDKINLLNESFNKLSKAYQPDDSKNINDTIPDLKINVRKINK
jgi:predicted S18 family serine protease